MQAIRAVFFDFDGTIANTERGIKNAIRFSLAEKGIPVGDPAALDYFIGPPLYDGYSHVYGTEEPLTSELVDLYRVYYQKQGVFELDLYPGIRELLEALKAAGIKTAVTSSKPLHFLQMAVPFVGIEDLLDAVIGPELHNKNADKTYLLGCALAQLSLQAGPDICMVGDRHYDVTGGKKAGASAIGVTYGFGSEQELLAAGADAIAHTPEELKSLLLPNS